MPQNSKNLFYIHDEDLAATGNYYIPADYATLPERTDGFVAGTTISSKTVNTALRQSSIFSVAMIDALLDSYTSFTGNVSPISTLDDMKSFIVNGMKSVEVSKSTFSTSSGSVRYPLTITMNGKDSYNYNGSVSKSVSFYAPTSSGEAGQFLKSNGTDSEPEWVAASSMLVGEASKVSSKFTIGLNGSSTQYDGSAAKSVSF